MNQHLVDLAIHQFGLDGKETTVGNHRVYNRLRLGPFHMEIVTHLRRLAYAMSLDRYLQQVPERFFLRWLFSIYPIRQHPSGNIVDPLKVDPIGDGQLARVVQVL